MAFLQLKSIGQTYFSKQTATTALEDITLSVSEGEFVSFLGPSGCGKSTLLSIISGLIQPTNGTVSLKNQLITKPHAKIGYMLQQDYLFPWKTIKDNILVGLKLQGCLNDERTSYALSLMSEIGLYDTLDKYPNELSGGMRQRVALVRTLATNPQILLLDEPFSALDYQTKLKLEDLVSTTLREHGKTAILVTHDIGEAIAMSDRIILFSTKPGRIFRTFPVSGHLRKRLPFEARQHPDYSVMFQQIWEELEQIEQNDTE
ncbi:ABC transporter ATP-binding protein [Fictibacillus enclensis]|uniref:ABC transporter ATP-binding protein n=1 Tax=Fictibacillus enclensis TaxID=1017270 RepID=UPI0025A0736A|nr:ABC transporter ATP-binding protein [Fictibacillus enclensis]MDM5200159.1 ABC transporter ATP-binding protein [Fictibacillus enclensis]MDM5339472.1 ABC transporter ATP-binding protein [Fictibacillus enclensis]